MKAVIGQWSKGRARGIGAGVVLLGATVFLLWYTNRFYPLKHWLFFRYANYWLWASVFVVASASAGHALVSLLSRERLPVREHLVVSFAVGVLAFVVGWFTLGLFGGFRGWTAIGWPLALTGAGAVPSFRWARGVLRKLRKVKRSPRRGPLYFAIVAFGVLAVALVYLPIITPANLAYDTRWYHMAVGEHYAADGGVRMFPEGWFLGAYPQLASLVYSWAFALPLALAFDKIELASHLEFVLFLYTLASIPVLVRRLTHGTKAPLSWVAMFLFPELFCYDSLLSGAADHVAAIWCVPVFLATLRMLDGFRRRDTVLLGLVLAGAMLSKYSAWAMVIVPGGAVLVKALVLAIRRSRDRTEPGLTWLTRPLLLAGVVLVATAPHWLKNLVWYHDPLYPLLHEYFPSRPWTPDTLARFDVFIPKSWQAGRSMKGVQDTLMSSVDFSFVPRDWAGFHRNVPIFGSLFTLAIPGFLFVRRRARLALLYLAAHVAVMQWFWSFHQDRYLQAYLPWMAAGTAGILAQLWRLGVFARVGVAALVLAQVVWGADVPFFPTHAMGGHSAHKVSIDLLGTGHQQNYKKRLRPFGAWHDLADALPENARILLHDEHLHLGIGRPTVSDWAAWQGGISYGRNPSPDQVHRLLKGFGVTHLVWPTKTSKAHDSLAADVAFFNYLRYAKGAKTYGGFTLARVPAAPPDPSDFRDAALVLGCNEHYRDGLYRVTDLTVQPYPWPGPRTGYPSPRSVPADFATELGKVDAVITDPKCFKAEAKLAAGGFVEVAKREELRIWMRNPKAARGK